MSLRDSGQDSVKTDLTCVAFTICETNTENIPHFLETLLCELIQFSKSCVGEKIGFVLKTNHVAHDALIVGDNAQFVESLFYLDICNLIKKNMNVEQLGKNPQLPFIFLLCDEQTVQNRTNMNMCSRQSVFTSSQQGSVFLPVRHVLVPSGCLHLSQQLLCFSPSPLCCLPTFIYLFI